ncbi:MAG: ATP-binding cassette domain-containing protein [Bacillota bacterium]
MSAVISIEKVWHSYARGTPLETASLNGLSLDVMKAELLALVGPTGSGKSTVLQHLNGLLLPDRGRVLVNGSDTRDKNARKRLWTQVGLLMQYPEKQFFEETVYREVSFGPGNLGLSRQETDIRVMEALSMVGLDGMEARRVSPFRLSGGEQRRVALASVLAVRPGILALDEPTAGIDPGGRKKIFETLRSLKDQGITIVMASHNMDDVAALADRVVVLSKGEIVLAGPARQVFANPGQLKRAGLDFPFPCEVIDRLNEAGFSVDGTPLTMDEAAACIWGRIRKRNPESRIQNPE